MLLSGDEVEVEVGEKVVLESDCIAAYILGN